MATTTAKAGTKEQQAEKQEAVMTRDEIIAELSLRAATHEARLRVFRDELASSMTGTSILGRILDSLGIRRGVEISPVGEVDGMELDDYSDIGLQRLLDRRTALYASSMEQIRVWLGDQITAGYRINLDAANEWLANAGLKEIRPRASVSVYLPSLAFTTENIEAAEALRERLITLLVEAGADREYVARNLDVSVNVPIRR